MDLGLKGKKAIVTGGTRGIGRAIRQPPGRGRLRYRHLCAHRRPGRRGGRRVPGEGRKAFGSVVDVADGDQLTRFVKSTAEALGGLDIFISNVGALRRRTNDEASWKRGFEIDVLGTVRGCETAVPFLEARGPEPSSSSDHGRGRGGGSAAGLQRREGGHPALPQSLGAEPRAKNVRANVVSPGSVYFKGGTWDLMEQKNPNATGRRSSQSHRPHGHAGRGGQRGGVPGQPPRQLHLRHQPDLRRRDDAARAVLTPTQDKYDGKKSPCASGFTITKKARVKLTFPFTYLRPSLSCFLPVILNLHDHLLLKSSRCNSAWDGRFLLPAFRMNLVSSPIQSFCGNRNLRLGPHRPSTAM